MQDSTRPYGRRNTDDDIIGIRFTDRGKQMIAEMYGFAMWEDFCDWRAAHPAEYETASETLMSELREEMRRERRS